MNELKTYNEQIHKYIYIEIDEYMIQLKGIKGKKEILKLMN